MMLQILLNLSIALVWTMLWTKYNILSFATGYIVGLGILILFRNQFKEKLYIIKCWQVFELLVIFIKEMIVANFIVIAQVLRPRLNIKPGIIALPTELETGLQVTILANMISLTPGTLSMEVSPDNKTIYIHVFNIDDEEQIVKGIKENFEKRIKVVAS